MKSAVFTLLKRLRTFPHLRPSPAIFPPAATKLLSTKTIKPTLSSTIYPLGHPNFDISPELDRWISGGNAIRLVELQNLIRDLRNRRRYKQALEVSEWMKVKWMKEKGGISFMASDYAVHLDLIGRVNGLSAAIKYFESLKERDKNEKTYGALLNCYVRERLIDESLSHLQKMKEIGMASAALPYNNIMCLYTNTGQHEKVPSVMEEMKKNLILPDNFSYRICINAFGTRSDIEGMEKVLEEMELQTQIVMDWNTYSVVANIYIKSGLNSKAVSALKKAEQKLEKKNGLCYNHLISLYGVLRNKEEMWRLWELQKKNCKKLINRDYTTMIGALVKLGELEEAEALLREWESCGSAFDFRVPNILLAAYRNRGLMEKAEEMIDEFLKKRKSPPSNSWGIVATGFAEKGEFGKACEFMTNALCVYTTSCGWAPNPDVIRGILRYLGDEGEIKMVENFVGLLKSAIPVNRDVYHTLIKCYVREGRGVEKVLESMKDEGIEMNEETQGIMTGFKTQNFASS